MLLQKSYLTDYPSMKKPDRQYKNAAKIRDAQQQLFFV